MGVGGKISLKLALLGAKIEALTCDVGKCSMYFLVKDGRNYGLDNLDAWKYAIVFPLLNLWRDGRVRLLPNIYHQILKML